MAIIDKGTIDIGTTYNPTTGINDAIEYISDWKDETSGNCMMDKLPDGRILINKIATGCGFTTWILNNPYNSILVSPRVFLIKNKIEQDNTNYRYFYFNRERDKKGNELRTLEDLRNEFILYRYMCQMNNIPMKVLVTYDSFCRLADMMEINIGVDINRDFKIYIDETHCLIKDVKLKEYNNKNVLSVLISRLFKYNNLVFVSATPIEKYLFGIEEFRNNQIDFYTLKWASLDEFTLIKENCTGTQDAFAKIFKVYIQCIDPNGKHYFDCKPLGGGRTNFSYEAVIFLNNIKDICGLIKKYCVSNQLINIDDVAVICSPSSENEKALAKVHKKLKITTNIPKLGQKHPTWLFVSRSCYEGVDFYSNNASTFVVANYNVSSLSMDVSSDLPQICGRNRKIANNPFRTIIHIFYTNRRDAIDPQQIQDYRNDKLCESNRQIQIYNYAPKDCKDSALANINIVIDRDPNQYYLSTVNGIPEINNLLMIEEDYNIDILLNHQTWFTPSKRINPGHSQEAQNLQQDLLNVNSSKVTQTKIKIVYDYFINYPLLQDQFYDVMYRTGNSHIAIFFNGVPLERIKANGYDSSKLEKELSYKIKQTDISSLVKSKFETGKTYSNKEVKQKLQEAYDELGLDKTAKATELRNYLDCEVGNIGDRKGIRIL